MKKRSIYQQFSTRLIVATSIFTIVISFMFYGFTKATVYEEIMDDLIEKAKIINKASLKTVTSNERLKLILEDDITVDLVIINQSNTEPIFHQFNKNKNHYIELYYPFDLSSNSFFKITKNLNKTDEMLHKIFSNVFILGAGGLIMIILYALAVSKSLLHPILNITHKLSNMNEKSLTKLELEKLPTEFHPLATSINNLTKKIENYVKYQKELFIGAAHELKTPLAVMKLKSEVALLKKRDPEKYQETLQLFINEINGMDKMITSILEIGRQEGAQFEKPVQINIVPFIEGKINNYKLLANENKVNLVFKTEVAEFTTIIQPTLLTQILQNFVQNAIKFTPENKNIVVDISVEDEYVIIKVIDEGLGINETIDLFAPFIRNGDKQGAGLGLFLVKSAAESLGGEVSLRNRRDNKAGAVATLKLHTNPTCKLKLNQ
ncbi:MAG TPA: HAMP domain-containing histidine kinase [Arcobacter sp.]|nr:HAMP domain-containing histidine kinase [Arcobacter sp.]